MTLDSLKIFRISSLIRLTLVSLYIALTVPLPFLAKVTAAPVPSWVLWIGIILGLIALVGALSEQVILDNDKIEVTYPRWFRFFSVKDGLYLGRKLRI